jgi:hypothetical protein
LPPIATIASIPRRIDAGKPSTRYSLAKGSKTHASVVPDQKIWNFCAICQCYGADLSGQGKDVGGEERKSVEGSGAAFDISSKTMVCVSSFRATALLSARHRHVLSARMQTGRAIAVLETPAIVAWWSTT